MKVQNPPSVTNNPSFTGNVDVKNSDTLLAQLSVDSSGNLNLALTEKAPSALTCTLAGAGAGNVNNGVHRYKVTFVTAGGETEAGTASSTVTVADKTADGKVELSNIPLGSLFVTARKIYRTLAGGTTYKLLTTLNDNTTTTYTDNTADASLTTTAPTLNTAIDNREVVRQGSVPCKKYVAILTQETSDQTSGTLIVGHSYTITTPVAGDNFTNVGAANNDEGTVFTATGTTPTNYSHGSTLTDNTLSAPTATVQENTLGAVPTFTYDGLGAYSIVCPGAFTVGKTVSFGQVDPIGLKLIVVFPPDPPGDAVGIGAWANFGGDGGDSWGPVTISIAVYP